jgi:c-di-GMP-binding flagellar brake protein YcgR
MSQNAVMGFEKRTSERIFVEQEIRVERGEEAHEGLTSNISLGGAQLRVELSPPVEIGERIRVSFRVPQLPEPLEAQAEVRWRSEIDGSLIGIQFLTGFRAKQTWALNRYLDELKAKQTES